MSSGKTDEYEYLTGEEILLRQQHKVMEQAKFKNSIMVNVVKIATKIFQTKFNYIKSMKKLNTKQYFAYICTTSTFDDPNNQLDVLSRGQKKIYSTNSLSDKANIDETNIDKK